MIGEPIQNSQSNEYSYRFVRQGRNIQEAQERIYEFLLGIVRKWPPEEVLLEFKHLFIHHIDSVSSSCMQAVYEIVFSNNQEEFVHTLKRSCYILINNWDASRNFKPISELIQLFSDPIVDRYTVSPTLKRLRSWIHDFVNSKDFEELKLFTSKYEDHENGPWIARYTSYLLVPQYIDLTNPIEQREAARALSKQLKDRFKFDLAMYIARSQLRSAGSQPPKNPTALGDEALRLIKVIVARKGQFSYVNLANIFLHQIDQLTFREFKISFQRYLTFSLQKQASTVFITTNLSTKLEKLYTNHDNDMISEALILRTCNRVIDLLTVEKVAEDKIEPTALFVQLIAQGNPITLVVLLLKIILICRHARTHLEAQIAALIKHYQDYPEAECTWVVNFLEVFNVTFAIYAENVQYNLVRMHESGEETTVFNPDTYRIFSQLRPENKVELFPNLQAPDGSLETLDS